MTPAEEARFIQLWRDGAETAAIAEAFGIPQGTVSSRVAALRRQYGEERVPRRPRGGNYPTERARERQPRALPEAADTVPVHTPVHTTVHPSAPVQRPVHTSPSPSPGSPDLSRVLNAVVERLAAIEETLKRGEVQRSAPVQEYAPVQSYALPGVEPPKLSAEDRKSERWNIYMPRWIRQRIEQAAAVEGLSPSQFLQRLCGPWAATWQDPEEGA